MNEFEFDMSRKTIPQGDCLLVPIKEVPKDATVLLAQDGNFILAHSETGHHHVIKEREDIQYFSAMDTFRGFLNISGGEPTELVHLREHHTHETQIVPPGAYLIQRQRTPTDIGWGRAID